MNIRKIIYPNLNDLTIGIVTYNRKKFILRAINYWSNSNVKVVIVDGSDSPLEDAIINNLPKNINYFYKKGSIEQRTLLMVKLVKTKFVLKGNDDEFYIPSALNSCIEVLKSNSEIVSCIGRSMKFNFKNNQTIGRDVYKQLKNNRFLETEPIDRIKKHFINYMPRQCFSVCKTNFWKIAMITALKKVYSFFGQHEFQVEFLLTFSSKSEAIPELMWLRSDENKSIRGQSPSMTPGYGIDQWWHDEKYSDEKKIFINDLELACKEISKLNKKKYNPNIISGFETLVFFFKNVYLKLFKSGFFSYPLNQLYYFYKKMPNFIKKPVLFIWRLFGIKLHNINELPFYEYIKFLEQDDVRLDYNELKLIENNIRMFHLSNKKNEN